MPVCVYVCAVGSLFNLQWGYAPVAVLIVENILSYKKYLIQTNFWTPYLNITDLKGTLNTEPVTNPQHEKQSESKYSWNSIGACGLNEVNYKENI